MRAEGYKWWVQRLRWATQTCDFIRLDHFRGFSQFWEIPASEPTAMNGRWVDGPKDELFNKLREELGGLPFFAEDLGYITPDVHELRERHQIPGMAVLQFGFGDVGAHTYLPHRLTSDSRDLHRHPRQRHDSGLVEFHRNRVRAPGCRRLRGALPKTESTGPSSAPRRLLWPASPWFLCRMCSGSAARPD